MNKSERGRKEFLVYNETALVNASKPNKMTLGNKILFSLYLHPE